MMHMQGHIDSEKQQNLDLSDLTQCKHCYKQFDTPFEMQTHVEKVMETEGTCTVKSGNRDSYMAVAWGTILASTSLKTVPWETAGNCLNK